jgi:hypothetical protein
MVCYCKSEPDFVSTRNAIEKSANLTEKISTMMVFAFED